MKTLNLYREELKNSVNSQLERGFGVNTISEKLGVDHRTISNWLSTNGCDGKEAIIAKMGNVSNNCLSVRTIPHYLVVCQTVEKFRPPDGITFPLIIADPPWNVSDPGHKRERKVRPRPFTKDFGPWDAFKTDRAYLTKCRQWLKTLYEVAAPDAWLFFWCSYRYISDILNEAQRAGWHEHTFYVWNKTNPLPMFGNNNFLQCIEILTERISPNVASGCRPFMRWRLRTLGYSSGAHIAIFPRFSPRLSVQGGRITPSTSGTRPIPCPCSATITSCSV